MANHQRRYGVAYATRSFAASKDRVPRWLVTAARHNKQKVHLVAREIVDAQAGLAAT
jgi:hypothetical protein